MNKKFSLRFVVYWIINGLILSLANSFFPHAFEMGNANLNIFTAVIVSSLLLTALLLLARGVARKLNLTGKGRYLMFLYYWGASSVSIWVVARIAFFSGFGIARYTWAIGVGLVVAFSHWLVRQAFKGAKIV